MATTPEQRKIVYMFHQMKMPASVYVCPKCRRVLSPAETEADDSGCVRDGELIVHDRCRAPMILFNRA